VGAEGLRVTTARGTYTLPPDVVLDEIPERYEGKLIAEELDEIEPKQVHGYENKARFAGRDYEDKSL
jgi:hypothetical protein